MPYPKSPNQIVQNKFKKRRENERLCPTDPNPKMPKMWQKKGDHHRLCGEFLFMPKMRYNNDPF